MLDFLIMNISMNKTYVACFFWEGNLDQKQVFFIYLYLS